MRKFAATLVLVLLLGVSAVGAWLWLDYDTFMSSPLPVAEPGSYVLEPGSSVSSLARDLTALGLLRPPLQPAYLEAHARLSGEAGRLQAGEYALTPGMRPIDLLDAMVTGKVLTHSLTIVEGWTVRQMLNAVAAHPKLRHTIKPDDPQAVMRALGHPEQAPEGRFFPDTYVFTSGTRDIDVLKRAYDTMAVKLNDAWERRGENLPLQSPDELLVLASIIEKETGVPEERDQVAGVFIRRLQQGMRLQTDPTVRYGVGPDFTGPLTRTHLDTDTPFNTYTRDGLPPTPIALPGAAALAAAVSPAEGDALYFVARGDGSGGHVFSRTLNEHNQAVRQYRANLRAQ